VRRVIDGDTLELADGRLVRYIGIDTPEVRRLDGDEWVLDPEPFSREAAEANRKLVEGRGVRLEFDVERHDRFGRLLAYVYVTDGGDERMVNAELLREGVARLLTIPPNVKYAERFQAAIVEAQQRQRGLWADADGALRRRRETVGTPVP
jgi:micrococcal nuclease